MPIENKIIHKGNLLIAKIDYDLKAFIDRYEFLKLRYYKKRQDIAIFNKSIYGKK